MAREPPDKKEKDSTSKRVWRTRPDVRGRNRHTRIGAIRLERLIENASIARE